MLERLHIRNFKRFEEIEVELGSTVLFIGPNNAGKTSALQALALWQVGVQRWHEKRGEGTSARQRSGVSINRRDLLSLPSPDCKQMWRDLHVRRVDRSQGKQRTQNIRIHITVDGIDREKQWSCGLEFDFANPESFYCRPIENREIPPEALKAKIAFLPPMSGLASNEHRQDPGTIQVLLGEGRTAEVLRNLCYMLYNQESTSAWETLCEQIYRLFGAQLNPPEYLVERGEITMSFQEHSGVELDLSASGRGLQQTLLLLAYVYANSGAVILLDEPDAHLEILRQRQVYEIITQAAQENDCQFIAASHSEILLNEAADRDVVVAFVGQSHRINDRGSQVLKALRSIGFDQYYQAEQTGWALYLEGATDLAVLRAFARTLGHPALGYLERPFAHYIGSQLTRAQDHFHGLREAKSDLVGVAILDRQEVPLPSQEGAFRSTMWQRREIENYLCMPEVLEAYVVQEAEANTLGPLFAESEARARVETMRECVRDQIPPAAYRNRNADWWIDVKASDEFLDHVFADYFTRLKLPNLLRKSDYHILAALAPREAISPEIGEKLDLIVEVAQRAKPADAQFSK